MKYRMPLSRGDAGVRALVIASCAQIKEKRITRVRNSIGSALLIDIGPVARQGLGAKRFGEWHLFVEMGEWLISRRGKEVVNSEQEGRKLKDGIHAIQGRSIKDIAIGDDGTITMKLDYGMGIIIKRRHMKKYIDWTLFYKALWSLTCADDEDQLVFECAAKGE